ncbi:hypothetical protein [Dyella psychrodurans]|uniref:Uncharacterized protein n=1 Tax=Dyella psychrodurans TaxID=1927960 RepID=A0A370XDE7_9GAMM|nr:hypothetical protein [Dyella psychrodurans]RDS86322.1 hypothetical protein DWU99_03415 [Dyella psychrodurans]
MTLARMDQMTREAVGFALWLAGVILNMAAFVWLGFQVLKWLHDGYWTNQPTVMSWMRDFCPGACSFVNNPHSWYGVARVMHLLYQMPSGLALSLIGVGCAVVSVSVADHRIDAFHVTKLPSAATF